MDLDLEDPDMWVDIRAELEEEEAEEAAAAVVAMGDGPNPEALGGDGEVANAPNMDVPDLEIMLQDRRLQLLLQWRENLIHWIATSRPHSELRLKIQDLVALHFYNDLMEPFLQTVTRIHASKLEIDSDQQRDEISLHLPLYHNVPRFMSTVARLIEDIYPIQHLGMRVGYMSEAALVNFKGIASLSLSPTNDGSNFWLDICNSLCGGQEEYPNLRQIDANDLNAPEFRSLVAALPTFPSLSSCDLSYDCQGEIPIEKPEARHLARLLSLHTLETFQLCGFYFANAPAAQIFCNGLRSTRVKKLELIYNAVPPAMINTAVDATMAAPIEELAFAPPKDNEYDLYAVLFRELHRPKSIRVLRLEEQTYDSERVATWLGACTSGGLQSLAFRVRNWTSSTLGDRIIKYVKSKGLQKLSISLGGRGHLSLSETFLNDLIDAADTRTRSLEEFIVNGRDAATWCPELAAILALNRERRIHGKLFDDIWEAEMMEARKECLAKALDAVDPTILDGFLRRNEWNFRELIMEYSSDRLTEAT